MYGQKILPLLSSPIFSDVKKCARDRLEKKWIPIFMRSPEFRKRHAYWGDGRRASIRVCVSDIYTFTPLYLTDCRAC